MYYVSVNRDALDKGEPEVVLVEDAAGHLFVAEEVGLAGHVTLGEFAPRPYGARVGLTCDDVWAFPPAKLRRIA